MEITSYPSQNIKLIELYKLFQETCTLMNQIITLMQSNSTQKDVSLKLSNLKGSSQYFLDLGFNICPKRKK